MIDSAALAETRDDVLKKIGRNLVIFQKMETMLKFLNAQQAISGSISELAQIAERAKQATSRLTMGKLVEALLRSVYSSGQSPSEQESSDEVSVTFSIRIEIDPALVEEGKNALRSVVEERNNLVHKRLAHFDPDSLESCLALRSILDEQYSTIRPELETLRDLVLTVRECQREAAQYFTSDAFLAELEEQVRSAERT